MGGLAFGLLESRSELEQNARGCLAERAAAAAAAGTVCRRALEALEAAAPVARLWRGPLPKSQAGPTVLVPPPACPPTRPTAAAWGPARSLPAAPAGRLDRAARFTTPLAPALQAIDLIGFPGEIMLRLLKMLVLPLVSVSMVAGVVSLRQADSGSGGGGGESSVRRLAHLTAAFYIGGCSDVAFNALGPAQN